MTAIITNTDYIQSESAKFNRRVEITLDRLRARKQLILEDLAKLVKTTSKYNEDFYDNLRYYKDTLKEVDNQIAFWHKLI